MALPNIKELVLYVNKVLTGNDWNTNLQKIVNWLSSGNTDIKVKSIELSQDGGIVNNGSLTQSGNLSVDGNISATGNLNIDGVISGDGSGLTGVISAAQVSYTPFCVNSGNVNSNGSGDLIVTSDSPTSIVFKVGDGTSYKPITFTNAKGKTTTLEAINSYDLSQTDNGTYIVYITENATAVTLTSKDAVIYHQNFAPTSPNPTDIWLDTSKEGLTSYIRQSGTWEEISLVPIAKVTVNNHIVQSAETFRYNQNGYNINTNTRIFGITVESLNSIVAGSKDTVYRDAVYPTLVICGSKENASPQPSGWTFRLQVSTDGNTWKTVMDALGVNGGFMNSVIIGAGVYWKYTTGLTGNAYVEYAPIKGA